MRFFLTTIQQDPLLEVDALILRGGLLEIQALHLRMTLCQLFLEGILEAEDLSQVPEEEL